MQAWYFAAEDRKLRHDDGRLVEKGVTHEVDCKPVLCEKGLHASKRILDALSYAPGPILCRVELGGVIVYGNDKSVATKRTYIEIIDATDLLREFARKCALKVIHLWDAPRVVRDFLETGDEALINYEVAPDSAAPPPAPATPVSRRSARAQAQVDKARGVTSTPDAEGWTTMADGTRMRVKEP